MTLRGRLTAAFLFVALGPVLLGATLVGVAVSTVSDNRSRHRLELAASTTETVLDAQCHQLRATAESAAALSGGGRVSGVADRLVTAGRAAGVRLLDRTGAVLGTAGSLPEPWTECGAAVDSRGELRSLVARVPMLDQNNRELGTAVAAVPLDDAFLTRLARSTGVGVTLLDGRGLSTVAAPLRAELVRAVVPGQTVDSAEDGLYVHALATPRPLPLALSVGHTSPVGLYAVLAAVVLASGLLAVVTARSLARSTTRPLVELAHAADRVAAGNFATQVPVRGDDEVGRLAGAFNRMTHWTQGYIAELTTSRDQLREAMHLSRTDPLTGLANYRYLEESLRREVERVDRYAKPLAVIALDLDLFKEVNDSYGHPVGDLVLVEVARRLKSRIRDVDRAFRQGGEEFALLLPETDLAGAIVMAERLGSALRDTAVLVEPDGPAIKVTVSIGIAICPRHGDTGPKILAAADGALYAAKAAGRDTYRIARGGALS